MKRRGKKKGTKKSKNNRSSLFLSLVSHILFSILFVFSFIAVGSQTVPTNQIQPTTLPKNMYKTLQQELFVIVERENPKKALEHLAVRMEDTPAIQRICHGLTHDIGQLAYIKYGSFAKAIMYEDEICGSGYMHGVVEGQFSVAKDPVHEMLTICNDYNRGKCYHAVGHGLMYHTNNDLPQSLAYCKTYSNHSLQIYCSEGVYMENFLSDGKLHPSTFVKKDDPFYPCQSQEATYKPICYFYAGRHYLLIHQNEYTKALAWCHTAEAGYKTSCTRGVGSMVMKENIGQPSFAEKMCLTGSPDQIAECIDGMMGYYVVNYDSLAKGWEFCNTLSVKTKEACYQAIRTRRS